jgi:hypothetical protein
LIKTNQKIPEMWMRLYIKTASSKQITILHLNSIKLRLLWCWTSHSRSTDENKLSHRPVRIQMMPNCSHTLIHSIPGSKKSRHPHRSQMQPNCNHKKAQELVWAKERGMVMVTVRGHCILAAKGP